MSDKKVPKVLFLKRRTAPASINSTAIVEVLPTKTNPQIPAKNVITKARAAKSEIKGHIEAALPTQLTNENLDLLESLKSELQLERYDCMVCFDNVKQKDRVWSCDKCYAVFHLRCVKTWATSKSATDADGAWRCPGCQNSTSEAPKTYFCFCGKKIDPVFDRTKPHSCKQLCGRNRGCSHLCRYFVADIRIPCHPGPCPPCSSLGLPMECDCGKQVLTLPCSQIKAPEFTPSCGAACGLELSCGIHRCSITCHRGDCADCEVMSLVECYCGRSESEFKCATKTTIYSCEEICKFKYKCGKHECLQKCHEEEHHSKCPFDISLITTCPCGMTAVVGRKECTDIVPTCSSKCHKSLACQHNCLEICHVGDCPPCPLSTELICRCQNGLIEVSCIDSEGQNRVLCDKLCKLRLGCGRHNCGMQCCDKASHPCDRLCSKKLACSKHNCLMQCGHSGPCHDCLEGVSWDELPCECGKSVIYPPIPCNTLQPACKYACKKVRECGHRHHTAHTCHPADVDCPPCMVFGDRPCACKSTVLNNIPCSRLMVPSCGKPCIKQAMGCSHGCSRVCHGGECVDATHPCIRKCDRIRSCKHVCLEKCHGVEFCPEDEGCKQILHFSCTCGNMNRSIACGATLNNPSTSLVSDLKCDDTCLKKQRAEQMALAFSIKPESNTARPFGGWNETVVKSALNFQQVVLTTESQLADLLANPLKPYLYFPKQKLSKANALICEMVTAYRFTAEWVDQNIGKGTVIARRVNNNIPTLPPKLLSEVIASYNPENPLEDIYIVSTVLMAPPPWRSNGLFIPVVLETITTENMQEQIRRVISRQDAKLFWLTDTSCFIAWDKAKSSEVEVEIEPYSELLSIIFKEQNWPSEIIDVSVSPLGGLQDEDGKTVGHARKRNVTGLRGDEESEWKTITTWKQHCILVNNATAISLE